VSIPPGTDPKDCFIKQYDFDADIINPKSDKWTRTAESFQVMEDIEAVVEGFRKGGPITIDGQELELPDVWILDDGVLMHDYIVAWICKVNNIPDPADWKQWGKRTQIMTSLIRRVMKSEDPAILYLQH